MNIIITNKQSQIIEVHKTAVSLEDWITQEGETKQSIKDEDFENFNEIERKTLI